MRDRYVIRYEYGQLVEGHKRASESLAWERFNASTGIENAHVIASLDAEVHEWRDAMRRCPVFVGQAV